MSRTDLALSTPTTAQKVLLMMDLCGYARLFRNLDDLTMARFVQTYYQGCEGPIQSAGGRIIKFIGDSCLATFDPDRCVDAVGCAQALHTMLDEVTEAFGVSVQAGINIHLAKIVEGEFGPASCRHHDILGSGVNQVFLMGGGPGTRLSEPVYRKLPSHLRSTWDKRKGPVIYHAR